jgi:eukaryotic-like serine/threonine-protein kinase
MTTVIAPEEVVAERYVVKRRLGAGGMGEAWLAEDRMLHRRLVLKRLTGAHVDASRTSVLLSEARRATAIESPHIAQVYDVCNHRGEWLLAMEYVPGQDLRTLLAAPLTAEQFFALGIQLVEAIQAAHASGILHCDIKPENIMVTEQGFVKVLDFGLARIAAVPDSGETVSVAGSGSGTFAGTPGYMAPEILREGAPTEGSDIFALGVVLYEMAGGKAPFKGKTLADSVHLTLAVEPAELDLKARRLPGELNRTLKKALNKDPERRYATVRDLAVDLKALQHQSLTGVRLAPSAPETGWGHAKTMIVVVTMVVALTAALIVARELLLRRPTGQNAGASAAPAAPQSRLLAVLPFHVIGADANSSAYSEGLREAITTNLASVAVSAHIEVLAASEVRAHALTTPEEAHKELGADLVIDGSYQQFRNEVHITYELSNAAGKILRSGNLSATLTDPFSLENHVVTGVLQMLSVSAAGVEQTPQQFGTQNPAAYDAYLRGVGYLRDFQIGDNLKNAAESFTDATRADPQFAAAYAGLGEAQWAEYKAETNMALITAARTSCQQAMKLGGDMAEAHICQATLLDGTGETPQAQAEFRRALELDPQSDTALNGLAQTWEEMDNPDQAEHVYREAIQTRPFYWANYYALANFLVRRAEYPRAADVLEQAAQKFPENSFLARRLGVVYFLEGRLDDAARVLTQAIAERPDAMAWMDLGQVYLHQRKYSLAITNLELAAKARPNLFSIQADLGDAYAWSGAPRDQAEARYRQALALSRSSLAVNAHDLDAQMVAAYSAAALGQQQDAKRYLNAALEHAPQDAEVNYYAARVYARLGDAATARQWVQKAIAHGYSQADIETAPDLAAVASSAPGK